MSSALFSGLPGAVDAETLGLIAEEIDAVEQELRNQVGSQVPLVEKVGSHTLDAGGKRLRPALVALSALASGAPFDRARSRRLGACMELIHMATLIHDDVIDEAPLRRGTPTAHSVFGTTASILSGDVLLAKAMRILAEDGDLAIIRQVSRVVVDLAEGEVLELEFRGRCDLSEAEHFEVLSRKTATFIAACCQVGGACAGAGETVQSALYDYGFHLGIAFQIVDDLLDYRGDRGETGKRRATDFREGCATLPLLYLLPVLSPPERAEVEAAFGNGVADSQIDEFCRWMADRGVFDLAYAAAEREAGLAKRALDALPSGPQRDLLRTVADFVLNRDR